MIPGILQTLPSIFHKNLHLSEGGGRERGKRREEEGRRGKKRERREGGREGREGISQ